MSGDGVDDVTIPMAFLFYDDAVRLLEAVRKNPDIDITLSSFAALEEGVLCVKISVEQITQFVPFL